MAVPTITSIAPARGHTGGRTLVEITGTGFALPPDPPDTGIAPAPAPSVAVTFGGVAALEVAVESDTVVFALSPISPATSMTTKDQLDIGPGFVDIVVQNLDADGEAIDGESVTAADAFEYVRPDLSQESIATIAIARLIEELRRQILPNVDFAVHTDWSDNDGNSLNLAYLPTLPALLLTDIEFPLSAMQIQGHQAIDYGDGRFAVMREPTLVDITCVVLGVAETMVEVGNLMTQVMLFWKKNNVLQVPRSPAQTYSEDRASYIPANWTGGALDCPLENMVAEPVRITVQGSNTNLKTFAFAAAVRRVPIEDAPGLPTEGTSETPAAVAHESILGMTTEADDVTIARQRKA